MPKIINLQNIKIKEILLTELNGKNFLTIDYALIDENGNEWKTKRIVIDDFTPGQSDKIKGIFAAMILKIKKSEEI